MYQKIFVHSDIPDTDSGDIATLWYLVSMTGKEREMRDRTSSSEEYYSVDTSSTNPNVKTSMNVQESTPFQYNALNFRERVLSIYGITIRYGDLIRPEIHFQVKEPTGCRSDYYTHGRGATLSPLWLEADDSTLGNIMAVYKCYVTENLVEAEFASYAREVLFKMDPLAVASVDEGSWRGRRMVELVTKPDDHEFWNVPPIISESDDNSLLGTYEWDIRPDCCYWLSLQAFRHAYVSAVSASCFVLKKKMICPYLTIEFKKDDQKLKAAENQVAVASCVALYNRILLKDSALRKANTAWAPSHLAHLRHYGITMAGAEYCV